MAELEPGAQHWGRSVSFLVLYFEYSCSAPWLSPVRGGVGGMAGGGGQAGNGDPWFFLLRKCG